MSCPGGKEQLTQSIKLENLAVQGISRIISSTFKQLIYSHFNMVSYIQNVDTQHEDMIHDAQMDFYGVKLATCSSDRSIRIFDVKGSQQSFQQELLGHEGPVWQLAWAHPKFGTILASCSYDKKVIIWQERNNQWSKIHEHTIHDSSVNSICWAPYELGLMLACGSSDGKISILSSQDGGNWSVSVISGAHNSGVNAVSWAPSTHPVSLLDTLPDQQPLLVKKIVSGGCDGLVKIWSFSNENDKWDEAHKLESHVDWVRDVAWAPLSGLAKSQIASCSQDGRVIVWSNDENGDNWFPKELQKFEDVVWHTSWSPTGSILAVSGGDNKVTLWKESIDGSWQCISNINKNQQLKS